MSVHEVLMGLGKWNLELVPETPTPILEKISDERYALGHIVITPTRVDPTVMADTDVLDMARYVGVYQKRLGMFEMGGVGVNWWAGEDAQNGRSFGGSLGLTTFAGYAAALAANENLNGAGIISAIAGTYSETFFRSTYRHLLDKVSERYGAEWRITNRLKLDWGLTADLFRTDPVALIMRRRGEGGRDPSVIGIVGDLDREADVAAGRRRTIVFTGSAGAPITTQNDGGIATNDTPFRNGKGTYAFVDHVVESFNTPTADAPALAASLYARYSVHEELTLRSIEYDIGEAVRVGDYVYVYDKSRGIVDYANPIPYRGDTVHPRKIRVVGHEWPIRNKMGVYFRRFLDNNSATWTLDYVDLTDYVAFETGGTSVDLGSKPRA